MPLCHRTVHKRLLALSCRSILPETVTASISSRNQRFFKQQTQLVWGTNSLQEEGEATAWDEPQQSRQNTDQWDETAQAKHSVEREAWRWRGCGVHRLRRVHLVSGRVAAVSHFQSERLQYRQIHYRSWRKGPARDIHQRHMQCVQRTAGVLATKPIIGPHNWKNGAHREAALQEAWYNCGYPRAVHWGVTRNQQRWGRGIRRTSSAAEVIYWTRDHCKEQIWQAEEPEALPVSGRSQSGGEERRHRACLARPHSEECQASEPVATEWLQANGCSFPGHAVPNAANQLIENEWNT